MNCEVVEMLVFSETTAGLPPSQSRRDLEASTQTARLLGLRVYSLEPDFERCGDAEGALAHVSVQPSVVPAVWIGYIPTRRRYREIYRAARRRRVQLINSPAQFTRAMEFKGFYSRLSELTPASLLVSRVEDCPRAVEKLGLPLFVKGTVQSQKQKGWKACVVETVEQLERRCQAYLAQPEWTRGPVVLRQLVTLRHSRTTPEGFPIGREYRAFLLGGSVLACGYYWEGDDPLKALTAAEQGAVEELAREAARRMKVPYLAVDIGQTTEGRWIVIETGDAQFCGLCEIPRWELWSRLAQQLQSGSGPGRARSL